MKELKWEYLAHNKSAETYMQSKQIISESKEEYMSQAQK